MPLTNGFNHIATLTPDLDRFAEWYRDVFEAEVLFQMEAEGDHPRMFILNMGNSSFFNVFEVPPEAIIGERRTIGARGAIDHFGIGCDSLARLEEIRDRLVGVGADIGEIQILGGDTWSLFFRDVDGMELEVCAPVLDGDPPA